MNDPDFDRWWKYHSDAHPAHAEWVDSHGTQTLSAWARALSDVDLQDARAATDALLRGDIEEPKGFGSVPKAIRRYAKQHASDRYASRKRKPPVFGPDGEPAFVCVACEDTGLRTCVHPATIKAFEEGKARHRTENPDGGVPFYTCTVACTCQSGTQRLPMFRGEGERYDADKFCEYKPLAGTDWPEQIRAWKEARFAFNPDEYATAGREPGEEG